MCMLPKVTWKMAVKTGGSGDGSGGWCDSGGGGGCGDDA